MFLAIGDRFWCVDDREATFLVVCLAVYDKRWQPFSFSARLEDTYISLLYTTFPSVWPCMLFSCSIPLHTISYGLSSLYWSLLRWNLSFSFHFGKVCPIFFHLELMREFARRVLSYRANFGPVLLGGSACVSAGGRAAGGHLDYGVKFDCWVDWRWISSPIIASGLEA